MFAAIKLAAATLIRHDYFSALADEQCSPLPKVV
jgi:hypothetical protein